MAAAPALACGGQGYVCAGVRWASPRWPQGVLWDSADPSQRQLHWVLIRRKHLH